MQIKMICLVKALGFRLWCNYNSFFYGMFILFRSCAVSRGQEGELNFGDSGLRSSSSAGWRVRLCWAWGARGEAQTLPVSEGRAGFLVLGHSWASPLSWPWAPARLRSELQLCSQSGQSLAEHTQPGWLQLDMTLGPLTSCGAAPFGFFFRNGRDAAAAVRAGRVPWSTLCVRWIIDGSALIATSYSLWYY